MSLRLFAIRRLVLLTGVLLGSASCKPTSAVESAPAPPPVPTVSSSPAASVAAAQTAESSSPTPTTRPALRASAHPGLRAPAPPAELWREFSGDRAMAEVEKQVSFGPRPSGSVELGRAREAIAGTLQDLGWAVERQEFTDETPNGRLPFVNLIARHMGLDGHPPGTSAQRAIVCSHYDTKRFSTIRFVGASDGASSTGALLEMARVLALDPAFAAQIELVFFDGEEAVQQFTETDGLYGSRHYAAKLAEQNRARQFKLAVLWDMIGDKDLTITLPPDSPADLARGLFAAAETLHFRQYFSFLNRSILDDHVPLRARGIPEHRLDRF